MLSGEKILVTGASGMVGAPLAIHLAEQNEVWGVARFGDPEKRLDLEQAGIITRSIDIGSGKFGDLPDDFTYVLHLNWLRAGIEQLEDAIQTNVVGPGLVIKHCRSAKAHLVMSSMPIYTPNPDPAHHFIETDPIGASSYAYAPTSPYSKSGVEAVARFSAQAFDVPIVICRLNSVIGPDACFPGMIIRAVLADLPVFAPHETNMQSLIHIDDMKWQIEAMLGAASNPAFIVNWGGDESNSVQDWVRLVNQWSGKDAQVQVRSVPGAPIANAADPVLRRKITGPCRMNFENAFRALYDRIVATGDYGKHTDMSGSNARGSK